MTMQRARDLLTVLLTACIVILSGCGGAPAEVPAASVTPENTLPPSSALPQPSADPETAAEDASIYFLNAAKWKNVGAYVYGDKGEVLGGWGSTAATPADALGGDWMKVAASELPPYSIIFYNQDQDAERAELWLPSADHIYVSVTGQAFTSPEEAEEAMEQLSTTVRFLNFDGEKPVCETVYLYASAEGEDLDAAWPGEPAHPSEIGENWWEVSFPRNASAHPFTVTVSDGQEQIGGEQEITAYKDNYLTVNSRQQLYRTQTDAEASVGIIHETLMYYLNSAHWETVGAYVYGPPGEALGSWNSTRAEPTEELGENPWVCVRVPAKQPFNIIFYHWDNDSERAELEVNEGKYYVVGSRNTQAAYTSPLAAEMDAGLADESLMTVLHFYDFLNWNDMNDIFGYFYTREDPEDPDSPGSVLGACWPGKAAEPDPESGEHWWRIRVPQDAGTAPFVAIFSNGVRQTEDLDIRNKTEVYLTPGGQSFDNPADAELAAAGEQEEDGCETGPNADLERYTVSYDGPGAALPYRTYEAEEAETNAEVLPYATDYLQSIQSEASGRQAVRLEKTGDYVAFTLSAPANSLVLRYSLPDSEDGAGLDSTLSLYLDGEKCQSLELTSRYAWVYGGYPYSNDVSQGNAHRFFDEVRLLLDETLPAGAVLSLQKDEQDEAAYYVIDFIDCELVPEPLAQPENSLSVADFGAVPNDGQDDYEAFAACLAAAKEQGCEVWIPAGTFDFPERRALIADSTTVRGAGMWYSNLNGAGAAFKYQGTSKFYDFSITGDVTVRRDSVDLAAFEANGKPATNITIENIWAEHTKVGVWTGDTQRMVIQGCRIRNTFADGINLCSGTSDTTIRNNNLRNTGDDCVAIWPWNGDCARNTISHNTIQIPTLANGVAVYGGGDNVVDSNHICDIINRGAGVDIGTQFPVAKGFTGPVTVSNNLLDRCGSIHSEEQYEIGAIWIWADYAGEMTSGCEIYGNVLNRCPKAGIAIGNKNLLTGLRISDITIDGATDAIYEYGHAGGTGVFSGITVTNLSGIFDNDQSEEFELTEEP